MSVKDNRERIDLRFLLKAWTAWFITALVLLLFFSFLIGHTAGSSRTLSYFSAGLSFLAAMVSGSVGVRNGKLPAVLNGLLCGFMTILLLLLLGFLIDRKSMSSDAVLSLVSFTLAGFLTGSVFFGRHTGKSGKKHAFQPYKGARRKG